MHGFALMMGSVFGHKWAAIVLKQCQKLVTVTKASHKLRFWLRTEMDLLKLSDHVLYKDLTWLVTIATTCFSSTYNCMLSVLRLQQAFQNMLQKHQLELNGRKATAGMTAAVKSKVFWKDLNILTPIAKPFNQVCNTESLCGAHLFTQDLSGMVLNQCVHCRSARQCKAMSRVWQMPADT